jgi:hypothetical protein
VDKVRKLTIEVQNSQKRIVQVRGRYNRISEEIEMRYVKLWAAENGLEIGRRQWL